MPAVLSDLEGVKQRGLSHGQGRGRHHRDRCSITSRPPSPGNLTPEQFDGFVRDTVNFLDYVGEPAQVERRAIGIWVVLFLLLLTGLALVAEERVLERRALKRCCDRGRRRCRRQSRSDAEES